MINLNIVNQINFRSQIKQIKTPAFKVVDYEKTEPIRLIISKLEADVIKHDLANLSPNVSYITDPIPKQKAPKILDQYVSLREGLELTPPLYSNHVDSRETYLKIMIRNYPTLQELEKIPTQQIKKQIKEYNSQK